MSFVRLLEAPDGFWGVVAAFGQLFGWFNDQAHRTQITFAIQPTNSRSNLLGC